MLDYPFAGDAYRGNRNEFDFSWRGVRLRQLAPSSVGVPQHPDQHRSERPMIYPLATEPPPPPERPSPRPDSHGRSLGIQPGTAAR
jgi:hypothetical protein